MRDAGAHKAESQDATLDRAIQTTATRLWFWAGLGFVAAGFAFLELLDPYFFCQDDALTLELPAVLMSCRGIWRGMLPEYNPFIFLGSPTPAIGGSYPLMYLAYGIARHLLGNEYATFDVFAAIHLIAGYCIMFFLARRLGIGPMLAVLASLTFVLSGPLLVMARCWHSFTVLAVAIPLFAVFVDRLRTGPVTWRWAVALGVALGAYYHSGFPQLFVLGCGILLIHAAALTAAGLMSLDDAGGGDGVGGNLLSMLLPYPVAAGTLPNDWGSLNLQWNGHFYYFGTVLLIAFLAALATLLRRLFKPRGTTPDPAAFSVMQLALTVPAIVAFLLALGESGGLWWLMGLLPVGLRNNPFRAMPWFVFFACLAGARYLEDFIASRPAVAGQSLEQRRGRLLAGVAGVGLVLVALHLTRVGIAFYTYGFRPYPELPTELAKVIGLDEAGRQQRLMSFAAMRSTDPSYPFALPHNLPCVYEVRWLVVHRTVWGGWDQQTPNRFENIFPFVELLNTPLGRNPQQPLGTMTDYVKVIEVPDAAPLAFDVDRPADALPLRMSVAGLEISLEPESQPRKIVANFLRYPDMVATVDGQPAEVMEDQWQRIEVAAPPHARTIRIRYSPPKAPGMVMALILALGAAGAMLVCRRAAAG